MTAYSQTVTLAGKGECQVIPRLPGVTDPVNREGGASATFTTAPQGTPLTYVAGVTTYTPAGAYYTQTQTAITFTATVQFPFGSDRYAVEYYWNFGDGTSGYGNPIQHTFKVNSASSQVTLRVTDNVGRRCYTRKQMYLKTRADLILVAALVV